MARKPTPKALKAKATTLAGDTMSGTGAAETARSLARPCMRGTNVAERTCSVDGCERAASPKAGKGMCTMHYGRWRSTGDPGEVAPRLVRGLPPEVRFWPKVDKRGPDECWPWTGGTTGKKDYGRFYVRAGLAVVAHRFAYELLVGPIPPGLQLDHLCRVHRCVNPAHLEPVTNAENQRRGFGPPGMHARATHCKRGHEFTPENTYRRPSNPDVRECLTCLRERNRGYEKARRSA